MIEKNVRELVLNFRQEGDARRRRSQVRHSGGNRKRVRT